MPPTLCPPPSSLRQRRLRTAWRHFVARPRPFIRHRKGAAAPRLLILFCLVVFLLPSLACAQAGEILTPAEATARAAAPQQPLPGAATPAPVEPGGSGAVPAVDLPYAIGDEVTLAGTGFLINLLESPGTARIVGSQERGAKVTVLEILPQGEVIWVRIQAPTGEGWVKSENLAVAP